MPTTALAHFGEDVARARAIVAHADPLPAATPAEQMLRSDNTVQWLLPKRKPPASMSLPQLYSWQGGYGDRYRQGSQRVRVLAHLRASPRSETYHPSRTGGRGPGPYRPRSLLLLPIAGMVHGLVCHRSGPVLLRLLPPGLPLAATVSPRRDPRAIYLLRGAQTSRHRPAAVLGQSGHRL